MCFEEFTLLTVPYLQKQEQFSPQEFLLTQGCPVYKYKPMGFVHSSCLRGIKCHLALNDNIMTLGGYDNCYETYIKSDHLWMSCYVVDREECTQINATFECGCWNLNVKMCGIHPIYEEDLEDILQSVDHSAWDSDDDFGPEACQISSVEDSNPTYSTIRYYGMWWLLQLRSFIPYLVSQYIHIWLQVMLA